MKFMGRFGWAVLCSLVLLLAMRSLQSENDVHRPLIDLCLRGGNTAACQRGEQTDTLEDQWVQLQEKVLGDKRSFLTRADEGALDPALFGHHHASRDPARMCGLLQISTYLVDSCGVAAPLNMETMSGLYWGAHDDFLQFAASKNPKIVVGTSSLSVHDKITIARRHVCAALNVVTFPDSSLTNSSLFICANPLAMTDDELLESITIFHKVTTAASDVRTRRSGTVSSASTVADLARADFDLVKAAAPPHMGLWLEWLVCTSSMDGDFKCVLGITPAREVQVRLAMDAMLVRGHTILEGVNQEYEMTSHSRLAYQRRKALQEQQVWRDPRLTHPRETILSRFPGLVGIVQREAGRLGAVSKA